MYNIKLQSSHSARHLQCHKWQVGSHFPPELGDKLYVLLTEKIEIFQVNPWISKHAQQAAALLDLKPWFSSAFPNAHLQALP